MHYLFALNLRKCNKWSKYIPIERLSLLPHVGMVCYSNLVRRLNLLLNNFHGYYQSLPEKDIFKHRNRLWPEIYHRIIHNYSNIRMYLERVALRKLTFLKLLYNIQSMPPEEAHNTSVKISLLMLLEKRNSVYFENQTKHTNTLFGWNAEFYCVKWRGTCSNNLAFKGYI
jgi:hypothetical protein